MSKFDLYVSIKELSEYFRLSEDYIRSQAQYEILQTTNGLEVISKSNYSRLSKVLYSQTPSLCVYTLESIQSSLRKVYDKREFIDRFLDSEPKAVVQDLFTGVSYYRDDELIDEYFQFVKELESTLDYSVERVAVELSLEPVQIYSLIKYLDLRLHNIVGSKTHRKVYILPKVTYSTVCAFLTQNTLVDLTKDLKSRLSKMGISPIYVKGVGTFVETSVLNYLQSTSSVSSIVEGGISYVSLSSFMQEFSLKPTDLSEPLKALFVDQLNISENYVRESFVTDLRQLIRDVDKLKQLKDVCSNIDVRLLILVLCGLVSMDEAISYISPTELKQYFTQLLLLKDLRLTKSSYKYLAEGSKSEIIKQMQLPYYSKSCLLDVLKVSSLGLPLDTDYVGYLNLYRLISFLNTTTENYTLPVYISNKEGYLRVATNRESWNSLISISSNILLAPKDKIDSELVNAYMDWEDKSFSAVKGEVEKVLYG